MTSLVLVVLLVAVLLAVLPHKVENLWARLKEWRVVAVRHDKTATGFLGGLHLAAAFDWLS